MSMSEGQSPATLKLRAFIDAVLAIAWSALPDGSLDFINERFREYTGLSSDRLIGWEWKSVVHPDDLQKLGTWWQDVRQSQEAGTTEKRLRRFDGAYRWFRVAAAPVRDEQANLVRWCGINTDIDDLKCSEQKFRDEAANFRTITDAIRQSITVLAPDGMRLYANQVFREVTGLTISEVNDKTFLTRVFHPDDLNRVVAERQEGLLREAPFEFEARVLMNGGQYRWGLIQYNPLKDERGQIIRWYSTGTDIDDRKRAEQELKRSEAFLAEGQRLSRTGSFSWCVATNEITWSEELYRIFEFDKNLPVTLERIGSRVYPDDLPLLQDMIERAQHATSDFEYQHRLLMPDQSVKHIHLFAHATRDRYGRLEYVGAAQDVTQHRLAEEALQSSERNLRLMIDVIPTFVHVLRTDGSVLYVNQAVLDYTGLTLEDVQKEGYRARVFHPDDVERLREERQQALTRPVPFENEQRVLAKDGTYRWFLIRYNPLVEEG